MEKINDYDYDMNDGFLKERQSAVETLQMMAREMASMAQRDGNEPKVTGLNVRFMDGGAYITATVKASRFISTR